MMRRHAVSGTFFLAAAAVLIWEVRRRLGGAPAMNTLADLGSLLRPGSAPAAAGAMAEISAWRLSRLPVWFALALMSGSAALIGEWRRRNRRRVDTLQHDAPDSDASATASTAETAPARQRPVAGRPGSELLAALAACRSAFMGVALFSGVSNILMLTGSFFMLEVYDRVLPSRSIPTLIGLCILASLLFVGQALLDLIRGRILLRVGYSIDAALTHRLFESVVQLPLRVGKRIDGLQPLRDMDIVRGFLSGIGPVTLFDLPWIPLYLGLIFAFHPLLGVVTLIGALILVALTVATEFMIRKPTVDATNHGNVRNRLAEASKRNAEVLAAMGFTERLRVLWAKSHAQTLAAQGQASDIAGGLGAIAKVLRMVLQSAVLAVGAYLVIRQEATGGIIIAGSILAGRALAPVDMAIAQWRSFVAARQSWARLQKLLLAIPVPPEPMQLPAPEKTVSLEAVSVSPPGDKRILVQDVTLLLKAGQGLGIVGPSGSGKSSLVRAVVGAWLPARGRVKLDGASLDQWSPVSLGQHIGYLPQDVELFAGTVAENIARFDPDAKPETVVQAAKAADVHDLIVALAKGYDTQVGDDGTSLSGGQRQRIGLARALYGNPFLVVLDEPDASLDVAGEQAVRQAIQGIRERRGIAIVISHRPHVLDSVDHLLAMKGGRALDFGLKENVLKKLGRHAPAANVVEQLKVVPYSTNLKP